MTDASLPDWIRPGIRFVGIRNNLRCSLLGLLLLFAVPAVLGMTTLGIGPPQPPAPLRRFFPPFPLPLPEPAPIGWRAAVPGGPDTY